MKALALLAALPLMTEAANYTAQRVTVDGIEVVRLTDESIRRRCRSPRRSATTPMSSW